MRDKHGFSLIEVVAALVLLGVGGVFATMYLLRGVQGYVFFSDTVSESLKVQSALERVHLEWREMNGTDILDSGRIRYTTSSGNYPGQREILFKSGDLYLVTSGSEHILLDEVQNGAFSWNATNGTGVIEDLRLDFQRSLDGRMHGYGVVIHPRTITVQDPN